MMRSLASLCCIANAPLNTLLPKEAMCITARSFNAILLDINSFL